MPAPVLALERWSGWRSSPAAGGGTTARGKTAPIATEALRRIALLYAVEAEVRGEPPNIRWAARQEKSHPLILDLFASGDHGGARWAAIASLIETCKLNAVDPQRYLTDLLIRRVNSWPQSRIDELMHWGWATADAG